MTALPERLFTLAKRFSVLTPDVRRELQSRMIEQGVSLEQLPIPPRNDSRVPVSASYAQQRLWFLWQLEPASTAYNQLAVLRLYGQLQSQALERSVQLLIDRHEVLRTNFFQDGDRVMQRVHPRLRFAMQRHDWSSEQAELERHVHDEIARQSGLTFDLEREPLLRVSLIKLNESEHLLLFCTHHIVSDAWSVPILVSEVAEAYRQFVAGREIVELPALSVQYADFAIWQRLWLEAGEAERQLAYWRQCLGAEPVMLELPSDHPRPATPSGEGERYELRIDASLGDAVRRLAAGAGSTVFMVLLASFQLLLYRYTGNHRIRVGTPVANRMRKEVHRLIGFFVNTLVMQAEFDDAASFDELLAQVRRRVIEAQANQDLPFEQLVDVLQPRRSLNQNPLFQVLYNHQVDVGSDLEGELSGVRIEAVAVDVETARFDLTFNTYEEAGVLRASFVYARDLFERSTIERMARHWLNLLGACVGTPHRPIAELQMLDVKEMASTLGDWRSRPIRCNTFSGVHERIELHAQRRPDATAVQFAGQHLSYRQLNTQANQMAHRLRELGVGADVLVGIAAERSIEMVIGLLAVLKAGGAYVPLEPTYPQERLVGMIEDSGISLLLTESRLMHRFSALSSVHCCAIDSMAEYAACSETNPAPLAHSENLAYVIFTSGSTGRAKGVAVSHSALGNYVAAIEQRLPIETADNMAMVSTFAADLGHTVLFGSLCTGKTLHLIPAELAADAAGFADYMQRHAIDVLKIVPSHLIALLSVDDAAVVPSKCLVLGGEACSPELIERLRRLAPACRLVNHYGPTETTVGALACLLDDRVSGEHRVPLGAPLANVGAYVCDASVQPVAAGCSGELYLAGAGLARGYCQRPGLTAERFVPNPFDACGGRAYRTGDRVHRRVDDAIDYIGRFDNQIKIRGYRVELGEIEACLRAHAWVNECAVLALEGPAGKQLIAYVVAAAGVNENERTVCEALLLYLQQRVPAYQVPSCVVLLAAMPLTPNGKLDRQALPAPGSEQRQSIYRDAENDMQARLVAIWQEVLGRERISITDNFFELGGDSIVSIQMVSRARQSGIRISSRDVFRCQTVLELAAVAQTDPVVTIDQRPVTGEMVLTPIQRKFFDTVIPDRHHWNQSVLLVPRQPLRAEALAEAISWLPRQHDSLRLRYLKTTAGWRAWHAVVCEQDVLWTRQATSPDELRTLCEQAQASLNLHDGPLFRVVLVTFPDGSQRLLIVIHHLLVDGVSWRILLEDLQNLYRDLADSKTPRLPAKTDSFQTWAARLQQYARTVERAGELRYWEAELQGASGELPLDDAGGSNLVRQTCSVSCRLSRDETRLLLQEASLAYRTQINELLLVALAQTLCRWTGMPDVLVQLEGHGREELFDDVDLSRTVGWFTSLYPVRLRFRADLSASIKAIKEQLRHIPGNGVGYGVLRYLGDDESRARMRTLPSPSITFNYLGQFDQSFDEHALFTPATEFAGETRSQAAPLSNWIALTGRVYAGELVMSWTFSHDVFAQATIERLAEEFIQQLRALIGHCVEQTSGGLSPSDVPLARLSQAQLDELPIAPRLIEDVYPLSPMQQGMLFHTLYDPTVGDYVNQLRVNVQGLNTQRFRQAWQAVMDAHDILRTSFHWQGLQQPLQIVHRQALLPFSLLDWRGLAERDARLNALADEERARCSCFDGEPLLRLALVCTDDDQHHLIYTNHHILMDGWSSSQLMGEVLQRYAGSVPPSRHGRYRDYVAWLQRQDVEACSMFWKEQLARLDSPAFLAGALASGGGKGHGEYQRRWSQQSTSCLSEFARCQKVTVNTLMQAAWLLLLQRYTGQSCVAFGATVAGRSAELAGIERQIGLFINTLPVIANPHAQQHLDDWLQEVQLHNVALREHEHAPLYEIQRWAGRGGDALFDTLLVFDNYPMSEALQQGAPEGLQFTYIRNHERTNYPLTMAIGLGATLSIHYNYDRQHFSDAAMRQIAGHFDNLLQTFLLDPRQRVGELPLLDQGELHRQLLEWNRMQAGYSTECCVHELIEEQAVRTPKAVALICGEAQLTYSQLNRRANQLAHKLIELGVGPEVRVGVATERGLQTIIGFLATLKAGGAYVPLDPEYPENRLQYMLQDSGVTLLLTQQWLQAELPLPRGLKVLCLDRNDSYAAIGSNPAPRIHPENLAYMIYTSGSSGTPKGVAVSHGPLAMHIQALADCYATCEADCELQFMSFSFDGAQEHWLKAMTRGARMVLRGRDLWTPEETYAAMHRHGVTVTVLPPVYLQQLAQHGEHDGNPPAVRIYCFGGDAVPESSFELAKRALRPEHIINGYGPTETVVTPLLWKAGQETRCGAAYAPIGTRVGDRSAYVLDDHLQLLPVGISGELYLGGYGVARGYHRRPGLTAERFIPDPFRDDGGRLYRSGDLTRLRPDGVVDFVGRVDHQVKIRGFRIELGEIETRLQELQEIREAVVAAQEGPGGKQLVAYVVPSDIYAEETALADRLRAALKAVMPEHMVPTHIMVLQSLPLTPNGKLDRNALPKPDVRQFQRAYVAPSTEIEQQLASIWAQVLNVERVGLTDNFFEMGGDSIISLQLVSRSRQQGIYFMPRDLFEQQTIQGLATVAQLGGEREADQRPVTGGLQLLPIQRWFFEAPLPDRNHWNQSVLLMPREPLSDAALERAVRTLMVHHDALRLRFAVTAKGWLATHCSVAEQEQAWQVEPALWRAEVADVAALEQLCTQVQASLDLQNGPMFRAALIDIDGLGQRLLLVIHHLVVDGVSWRILLEDLRTAYRLAWAGQKVQLPAKTSSYQAWSERLLQYAHCEQAQAELNYWLTQLQDRTVLPCADPDGSLQSRHGQAVQVLLGREHTHRLLHRAPAAYRTQVNDLLLTALTRVVARWTGQGSALIQLEGHGREELFADVDLTRTVGWFTSVFPVRLTASTDLGTSIKQVKEQLRAIPRKGIGFGVLRYLSDHPVRKLLEALPTPRITFNYLGQFDNSFATHESLLDPASEPCGSNAGPDAPLGNWLSVSGKVHAGQLLMDWTFSRRMFEEAVIQQLADDFVRELRAVIEHCCADEVKGGVTPSDFPLANLVQSQLDALPVPASRIEDIYPLSLMQETMLLDTAQPHEAGDWINQMCMDVQGIDPWRYRTAWQSAVDTHDVLRTSFVWDEAFAKSLQIVNRHVEVPFVLLDGRGMNATELDETERRERLRDFDMQQAPLLRLLAIRTGDASYRLICTSHHILLDGWSGFKLFNDVLHAYVNGSAPRNHGRFSDYIAWLQTGSNTEADAAFWREQITNLRTPTLLARSIVPASGASGQRHYYFSFDSQQTRRLSSYARQHKVTVNTLLQAAWLLLLHLRTGQDSVVCGITVAGRPPQLKGIEQRLGLYINNVPLVATPSASQTIAVWLQSIQACNVSIREHCHTALNYIEQWAGLEGGKLFDTLIVFENYPVNAEISQQEAGELRLESLHCHEQPCLPLTLYVELNDKLRLHYNYRLAAFDAVSIESLNAQLIRLISLMLDSPVSGRLDTLSLYS